jgi:uncharacterized protein YjdB
MYAGRLIKISFFIIIVIIVIGTVAYAEDEVPVTGIYMETTELVMKIFTTEELSAWVIPASASNKKVSWYSGDKNKVQIIERSGSTVVIEALSPGTTNIYATTEDGQFQNYCRVEVVVPISKIFLEPLEVVLAPGEEVQYEATVEPQYATVSDLIWQSSDNGVITVDQNGLATAYRSGEARIIARAEDNDQIFTFSNVTVEESEADESVDQLISAANDDEGMTEEVEQPEVDEVAAEEQPVDSPTDYDNYIFLGLGVIVLIIVVLLVLFIKQRRTA